MVSVSSDDTFLMSNVTRLPPFGKMLHKSALGTLCGSLMSRATPEAESKTMTLEQAGYFTGAGFPIIFTPVAKRRPQFVYSACGAPAVVIAILSAAGGADSLRTSIDIVCGVLFPLWGYRRVAKKIASAASQ